MNLTVSKKDALRLLSRMQGVADRKSTMPVLQNVLLTAHADRLEMVATDLYLSLSGGVAAEVSTPGTAMANAKDLVERVKAMPDGPLVISSDGKGLTLKTKGAARRYTLRSGPGDDYPPIPRPAANAQNFWLETSALASLIGLTHFSISTDETRVHLNSALLEWDDGVVRMVSTDGHRLSKAERKVDGSASATMLVPLKAIQELRRIAEGDSSDTAEKGSAPRIAIIQSGNTAFFEIGGLTFGVRLVDAQFPPWRQVIPSTCARTVRIARGALIDALRAVAVAANERTGGVRLSFDKGMLRITGESPDSGDGTDELPYDLVDGKDGALIGLNAKYPLDALNALSSDEVTLGIGAELDPILVKPVGGGETDYVGVLMPMRLRPRTHGEL